MADLNDYASWHTEIAKTLGVDIHALPSALAIQEAIREKLKHMPIMPNCNVVIDYTNWEGRRREREITPFGIYFGSSVHHEEKQWLLLAWDMEKCEPRHFAMNSVHSWRLVQ